MNILTNTPPTEELQRIDARHHMHPFSANAEFHKTGARVIKSAKGAYLYDNDGNEFLDAMAGLWCVNIGYGRTELAEVAYRQMQELPFYNTFFKSTHVPVIALSEKLASLAPKAMNNVFFANGGSDANDTNVRMVRHYWARMGKPTKKTIISRLNAYHGSTMAGASLGGMKPMHAQGGLPIADIVHINQPAWYAEGGDMDVAQFGLARAQELEAKILELGEENVAAFIGEPVQGAGGVIIPPETYWPEIQRICRKYNILLIVDEVICGFGRTANMWGSETFDITGDVMTIAKGLSSGYAPIGGSIVSDKVASVLAEDDLAHGYTYSGHPVSCAVALENLRIIEEENLVDHVQSMSPYLAEKWTALGDHPLVGEARISGFMGALALTPDKTTRAEFKADKGTVAIICRDRCYENGLVMRQVGDQMIISPPLILEKSDIDKLIDRCGTSLDECYKIAGEKGLLEAA
ncbi:MAG: aspartate aminotransferase family protein [Pseudomonadota bacterium]